MQGKIGKSLIKSEAISVFYWN